MLAGDHLTLLNMHSEVLISWRAVLLKLYKPQRCTTPHFNRSGIVQFSYAICVHEEAWAEYETNVAFQERLVRTLVSQIRAALCDV